MNTRIQVEHGIPERVTGLDIVKEQIHIASGETLSIRQQDVKVDGHAIECRITAETGPDFRPATGTISGLHLPGGPGVRVDTHIFQGYTIPAHYDSLIAKIMVHGHDRDEAIMRMQRTLMETRIDGVPNTVPYLRTVLDDAVFRSGNARTDYVLASQ